MVIQQETLCILRISMLCYLLHMNCELFQDLLVSSVFDRLPEETQFLINNFMSAPTETASTRGAITSEGVDPEVMSMEVPTAVPKAPRSPRPKPMLPREVPKTKKDEHNKML